MKDRETEPIRIQQHSTGVQSPNVVTLGNNSPVTIHHAPKWALNERELTDLVTRLKPFARAPQTGIHDFITAVMGDSYSLAFAYDLERAFRMAGWNTGSGVAMGMFNGPVEGIILKIRSADARPLGSIELATTLKQAGIQPFGEVTAAIPENEFRIIVGSPPKQNK
jgi:hypothetical protein